MPREGNPQRHPCQLNEAIARFMIATMTPSTFFERQECQEFLHEVGTIAISLWMSRRLAQAKVAADQTYRSISAGSSDIPADGARWEYKAIDHTDDEPECQEDMAPVVEGVTCVDDPVESTSLRRTTRSGREIRLPLKFRESRAILEK